jgi:hypothetical protein
MRDTPSYGTRCIRRTSKRILRARGAAVSDAAASRAKGAAARAAAHSSHSMTVPWMLKKGRATEVCHDCGDLVIRLLSVSRLRSASAPV